MGRISFWIDEDQVDALSALSCPEAVDQTLVMTFSEFGRRVAENQNAGTDHGTANVMFMAGGTTKPGFHGTRADLAHLDSVGDLIYTTDFRSIYAAVLQSWLKADLNKVGLSPISPLERFRN